MGRVLDHIDEATQKWIGIQHMFFVATAPSHDGRVNMSPKGLDSLRVLGERDAAYLDLTGSGAETIAHIRDTGRITLMWNAFDGPPRIVRVYGKGRVHLPTTERFRELVELFPQRRAIRSVITVEVERVQDSCGYSVPKMQFVDDRSHLDAWVDKRTDADVAAYWVEKNTLSIDGLPALELE
jgi:hypothetical protein